MTSFRHSLTMASTEASTSKLVYHDVELGNPRDLAALTIANASPETLEAVKLLNHFARDMAAGNVLIPGLPQGQQPNPRSDRVKQAKEDGNQMLRKGQAEAAADRYTLAAGFAATRPVFEGSHYAREELIVCLNNRAAAYLSAKKWVEALVDADAVLKLRKENVKAHYRKGRAFLGMGRTDEAREAYLLGLEFDPSNEVRCALLASLCMC